MTRFCINVSVFACQSSLKGSLFPAITHYSAQKAPCHPPSWNVMHAIRRDCSRSWGAGSGAGTGGGGMARNRGLPEESLRGGEIKEDVEGAFRKTDEVRRRTRSSLTTSHRSYFPLAVINTHQQELVPSQQPPSRKDSRGGERADGRLGGVTCYITKPEEMYESKRKGNMLNTLEQEPLQRNKPMNLRKQMLIIHK